MSNSGEAAEQSVKLVINGVEETFRITGAAAKSIAALLQYMQNQSQRKQLASGQCQSMPLGYTKLENLLREGCPIKCFSIEQAAYKQFQKQAKKLKIHYATVKNKKSGLCNIVARANDVDLINLAFRNIGYGGVNMESATVEPAAKKKEIPQKSASTAQYNGLPNMQTMQTRETTEAAQTLNEAPSGLPPFMAARMRQKQATPIPAATPSQETNFQTVSKPSVVGRIESCRERAKGINTANAKFKVKQPIK